MNAEKTGLLIKELRTQKNMTQAQLAEILNVSDKAVSKWERGQGIPDISLFPILASALSVDERVLLSGELNKKSAVSGNMRKTEFFVCPDCGNVMFSLQNAEISCCGKPMVRLTAKESDGLDISVNDGELYVTFPGSMSRENYISFIALVSGDTLIFKKLYPEWSVDVRFPLFRRCTLYWYVSNKGLMKKDVTPSAFL